MEKIKDIAEAYIAKIADSVFLDNYDRIRGKSDKDYSKEAMEAQLNITHNESVRDIFFQMLDEIEGAVTASDVSTERVSFKEYYKDMPFVDISEDTITDIFGKGKAGDTYVTDIIIDNLRDCLASILGQRVVELYYYKQYHRWYDSELEEAFREIVTAVFTDSNNIVYCLSETKDINDFYEQMILEVCEYVYDKIYNNPYLEEKYKLDWNSLVSMIDDKSSIFKITEIEQRKRGGEFYFAKRYKYLAEHRMELMQYCSFEACYNDTFSSETVFSDYFKWTLTPLAGFSYNVLKDNEPFAGKFILKTMSDDFTSIAIKCKDIFGICFLSKESKPTGEICFASGEGFQIIADLNNFYLQLLIAKCGAEVTIINKIESITYRDKSYFDKYRCIGYRIAINTSDNSIDVKTQGKDLSEDPQAISAILTALKSKGGSRNNSNVR